MNPTNLDQLVNYIPFIVALEIILLLAIVITGVLFLKHRKKLLKKSKLFSPPRKVASLHDLVQQAQQEGGGKPLNVSLVKGEYKIDKELTLNQTFHLYGSGAVETRLISTGNHPALRIKDAKDCQVSNVRIEGSISCSNSELLLENCHIIAKKDGICIEAFDGSVVTFSGLMRGEGGIAIRARGESQVILKPPYAVSDDDYVVIDPKSEVTFNKDGEEAPGENSSPPSQEEPPKQ